MDEGGEGGVARCCEPRMRIGTREWCKGCVAWKVGGAEGGWLAGWGWGGGR